MTVILVLSSSGTAYESIADSYTTVVNEYLPIVRYEWNAKDEFLTHDSGSD